MAIEQNHPIDQNEDGYDSHDEALCEMLGLKSLVIDVEDESTNHQCTTIDSVDELLKVSDDFISEQVQQFALSRTYLSESVCVLPESLAVPAFIMRRLTDELVWGGDRVQADRTYETIKLIKNGEVSERRTLTRLENFVASHSDWSDLCNDYLRRCVSAVLGEAMVLYKEKLNLKPPGGSGFAPHLDGPSLRVALGDKGPQTFVTVMVAIDDMTPDNGCLRVAKGKWREENSVPTALPEIDGNPDAGGRAGAIVDDCAESLRFEDLVCKAGRVALFNGWMPHRSSANKSLFPRRAVFLTYNPSTEGDFHEMYYDKMRQLREDWKRRVGLASANVMSQDDKNDIYALTTIPRI